MNFDPNSDRFDARLLREEVSRSGMFAMSAITLALVAFLAAIAALIFAATRSDGGSTAVANSATATRVTARLLDYRIVLTPSSVPAGPVILEATNGAATKHDIVLAGVAKSRQLAKGESQTLDLGTLEEGKYTFVCDVPGHKDLGMVTTLTVTAGRPQTGTNTGAATAGAVEHDDHAATTPTEDSVADWKAVDAAHEKVVKDFLAGPPAPTAGRGNQPMDARVVNGVRVFDLTAKVVQWEVSPGVKYEAWTYNGAVPGPELRVKQGETVKIRLKNDLPESTSIHFHGVEVNDNKQDGVTFVTQDPIVPGATYEYTLTPINCGSHMYHSHHSADAQVPLGLLGAFIVDCTTTPTPEFARHDSEYTQILTDGPLGFGINGKGFPATDPVVSKVGERTLVRFMNEGLIIHPMHLHGHTMTVVSKDGNFFKEPMVVDTLSIAPGERYDVIVESRYPGAWAFHCHILTHAESPQGLHGMTTVWVVQPADEAQTAAVETTAVESTSAESTVGVQ